MLPNSNIKTIKHEQMNMDYIKSEKGLNQAGFYPSAKIKNIEGKIASPNFQLSIAGKPYGFMSAGVEGYSELPYQMDMIDFTENEKELNFTYKHPELKLKVIVNMQLIPDASVVRQVTKVINEGDEAVTITHLSSLFMQGIALEGIRKWHDKNKIKVHYCRQTWHGEGQWRSGDLEELGLYPASIYNCDSAIHFSSIGSFSTTRYLPMAVIEDMETNKVWYFQIETSTNWHYEIGFKGETGSSAGSLYIHADAADERFGAWAKTLKPGECFESMPAAIGCCSGNFNDAIKELTKYRRSTLKPKAAWEGECPLIFNDYMDCLWGQPTKERLIPLIDKAAEIGAEGFCIDAGWFADLNPPYAYATRLGDWLPSKDRFGESGVQGILDYIKGKGMLAGLWLEMEVCGEDSKLSEKPDSWFLMRNGKRAGGGMRYFLNFTNPEVRNYIHGIIDRVVSMGADYIKNDYNDCIGIGDDELGTTAADGLITHIKAFYSFIDEVRARHPRLIIENCGSGAMREDYGILSHFHLQSLTDQVVYKRCPSVIVGSLAAVLPEQLGIWTYPWPIAINDYDKIEKVQTEEYKKSMEDGEQTVFNLVSGLCGNMYLSGHVDCADDKNTALIKEGIELYKTERSFIRNAYPFWPLGFNKINDENTWAALGLASEDNKRVLLAVWRLKSAEDYMELPLYNWQGRKAKVRQLYPHKDYHSEVYYNSQSGTLTVQLDIPFTARYFEIVEE